MAHWVLHTLNDEALNQIESEGKAVLVIDTIEAARLSAMIFVLAGLTLSYQHEVVAFSDLLKQAEPFHKDPS